MRKKKKQRVGEAFFFVSILGKKQHFYCLVFCFLCGMHWKV